MLHLAKALQINRALVQSSYIGPVFLCDKFENDEFDFESDKFTYSKVNLSISNSSFSNLSHQKYRTHGFLTTLVALFFRVDFDPELLGSYEMTCPHSGLEAVKHKKVLAIRSDEIKEIKGYIILMILALQHCMHSKK